MCGIAGVVNLAGGAVDPAILGRMSSLIRYRGPDDAGHVVGDSASGRVARVEEQRAYVDARCWDVGLANRRLAIIDLSRASHQPMANEDGSLWVTFNGEIYNYVELARELRGRGHVFRSASDTEVIVHAYEEWGNDCVTRFNGMWAFALWDARRRALFCSRDRFGEKPFYYAQAGDAFVFASEIKALRVHPGVGTTPDGHTVFRYVASGYGFTDVSADTFFEGVRRLPAAHSMLVSRDGIRIERYWQLQEPPEAPSRREAAIVQDFRELFEDVVRLRLRSDVPVGFSLSGGLDSSAIVCTAAAMDVKPMTFSACSDDPLYDERAYIGPVVERTKADAHFVFPDGRRLMDVVDELLWHQDEPWANLNIYAQWLLMERARREGVRVLLNGHGGDETLAGYYPHFASFHADLLRTLRWGRFWRELRAYCGAHGRPLGRSATRAARRLGSYYLGGRGHARPSMAHLDHDFVDRFANLSVPSRRFAGVLHDDLRAGLEHSPLPAWLRCEDRNSMAFSVETRQPFLDHRLVEFLFAIPDEHKLRDGMSKVILRRALADVLPSVVRTRSLKIGFKMPAAVWLRNEVHAAVWGILTSREFRERGIFDGAVARRRFQEHCDGKADHSFAIWSWVNLELWFRKFFT